MPSRSLASAQILEQLAAAPARIAALTAAVAPAQLQAAPAAGAWSANQVLAHLRACADVWGGCIAQIIAHDRPALRAINPTTWLDTTDYREQAFQPSLQAYTAQRADLLASLNSLPAEAWARTALVTGAGKPLERTVLFYAEWLARHERTHLKQLERTVSTLDRQD